MEPKILYKHDAQKQYFVTIYIYIYSLFPFGIELLVTPKQHSIQRYPNIPLLQMQMPWHNPLVQTERKVLRKLHQLIQTPLHLPNQILILRPQVILDTIPENRRHPCANPRRLLVRQSDTPQKRHLPLKLVNARVEKVRVEGRRRVEPLQSQMPEVIKRRTEEVLDVGEEEGGAAENQAGGFLRRGGNVGGEEVEDGVDTGGVELRGEEVRGEEGEAGEVGVGEALGLEEVDRTEDAVDVVGEGEVPGFGVGVDNAEAFKVPEIFAVGSAELDEAGRSERRRRSRGEVGN